MTVTVDTNVLLRWLLDDVPAQSKVVNDFFAQQDSIFVPDIVFHELSFTLAKHYEFDRSAVRANLESVLALPNIVCSYALLSQVLPVFEEHPSLSFADVYLAALAEQQHAVPLYTFDKQIVKHLQAAAHPVV